MTTDSTTAIRNGAPTPVASWRHTLILTAILLVIAIRGAMFQFSTTSPAAARPNQLAVYVSLLASEGLLLYAVARGIRRSGLTLRELIGGSWVTPARIVIDALIALATWGAIKAFALAWQQWMPFADQARSISGFLPSGAAEVTLWIMVSTMAGLAEEVVFRGYFQRQFEALTRNRWTALVLQAILFGVTHGYQGVAACMRITIIGMMFGAVALWRRSLRPGILAHALTDIMSGVFRI